MAVRIFNAKELPRRALGTYGERYRFDDLKEGMCMELIAAELDDNIEDVLNAYNSYAVYRGINYTRQKTEEGFLIWNLGPKK